MPFHSEGKGAVLRWPVPDHQGWEVTLHDPAACTASGKGTSSAAYQSHVNAMVGEMFGGEGNPGKPVMGSYVCFARCVYSCMRVPKLRKTGWRIPGQGEHRNLARKERREGLSKQGGEGGAVKLEEAAGKIGGQRR